MLMQLDAQKQQCKAEAEKATLINIVCGRIKEDKVRKKSVLEKVSFKHI